MLIYFTSLILIIYTMIGYPILLKSLSMWMKKKVLIKEAGFFPSVTCIVTVHNEERIILKKLKNLESCRYPNDKFEIIITSDFSNDRTNTIVQEYIENYSGDRTIRLHQTSGHKGKTNAQNEAASIANGEIYIFSDANAMLGVDSIRHLAQSFSEKRIGYVSGKLVYTNPGDSSTSQSESSYWDFDLQMRKWESDLSSITAGNGALYAIRGSVYTNIPLTYSHDSYFPPFVVTQGKRAIFDEEAIAYEKAGETNEDEFKRKIRMSRNIFSLNYILPKKYNIFKNGWFTLFYVSHRTFRNNLYLFHLVLFISNLFLISVSPIFLVGFIGQICFYLLALLGLLWSNPYLHMIHYYVLTLCAQFIGVIKELTGQSKATWEKAESTRK